MRCQNRYLPRFLPPEYHDDIQSIRRSKNGRSLPSARDVTSLIHENKDVPLASVTHMLMQWGQFVDHDLTGKKFLSFYVNLPFFRIQICN